MEVNIIKVGNLKGLRLPKSILDEYQIKNSVELRLKDGYIELRPVNKPRSGWKSKLERMVSDSNEETRIDDFFEDEDILLSMNLSILIQLSEVKSRKQDPV